MKLGAYELLERIAVGGMAEVFLGRAVGEGGFEKQVAIKRILPHLVRDERFVSMLVQEARIHAGLSHRNIVQIHDLGLSEDGEYFIVLEYVDGRDLGALLQALANAAPAEPGLSDAVALHVLIEAAQGVHSAHALADGNGQVAGLVHRDISPSNLLVSYAGEVKLSDFGLAKRQSDHSVVGSLKGKLAYMSPEQARRWPLDRRSDIFALGAVLFELLTRRRLREIEDEVEGWRLVASGVMSSASALRPDLPPVLERLLNRALAPDPKDRFSDAASFVAAAKQALEQVPRPSGGEAAELKAVLRRVLPPGAPRPSLAPSRVIRLQSQFFQSPAAAQDMGVTRPAAPLAPRRRTTPPPPPLAMGSNGTSPLVAKAEKATLRGTPPVPPVPVAAVPPAASLREARASGAAALQPSAQAAAAPLTAFNPVAAGDSAKRRSPAPAARVPADDLVPVSGELASPARPDRPLPHGGSLQLPADLAAVAERPPVDRITPPSPSRPRATPASAPVRATPVREVGLWAQPFAAVEGPAPYPSPRAAALALGTPGIDAAAITPRLAPAPRLPSPGFVQPKRLWPTLLGALSVIALGTHFLLVPLPVLARWGSPAKLVVQSMPEGAEVWLDGKKLDAPTPTFVQVNRDRRGHVLQFRKPGYEPSSKLMRFDQQVRLTVNAALAPRPGPRFAPLPTPEPVPAEAPGVPTAVAPILAPEPTPGAEEAALAPSAAASVMKEDARPRARAVSKRRGARTTKASRHRRAR